MKDDPIRIEVSAEEVRQFVQLAQHALVALSGARLGCQPIGPFVTIEDRVKERWPMATKENQRRIRDVCLGK